MSALTDALQNNTITTPYSVAFTYGGNAYQFLVVATDPGGGAFGGSAAATAVLLSPLRTLESNTTISDLNITKHAETNTDVTSSGS